MIFDQPDVSLEAFERATGWAIKPQGACRDERCVTLPEPLAKHPDIRVIADRLGMAMVHDDRHNLWAVGPESGGRALNSAAAPDLQLPDWQGNPFSLSSLRGHKVFLLAWASW